MLSRKRPSRNHARLRQDRRRSLQRGIQLLEARLPLAGTSPDTFVLQPNSISYESDAVIYSQMIGEPTVDAGTGQTTIDLRVNGEGDQVGR